MDLIPQTEIYTIFDEKNPLYKLALQYPKNMCWLTTLYYALQFMGFSNNKKLHKKLSRLLTTSIDIMHIGENNGALYFPKKYQLSDRMLRSELNKIFKDIGLKIRVEKIISSVDYDILNEIIKYLIKNKQLLTIVKNIDLSNPNKEVTDEVPNHVVLIKEVEDTHDGKVRVVFIDPSIGKYLEGNIGFHAFIQWIQYVWVLDRKKNLLQKIVK